MSSLKKEKNIHVGARLTEPQSRAFRIALAVQGESAQVVIEKAVIDYIKAVGIAIEGDDKN